MAKKASKKSSGEKRAVDAIRRYDDKRTNIPTVEMESVVSDADKAPKQIRYPRNTDLHLCNDLKNTGKGNLFVIFGEPDIDIIQVPGEPGRIAVKVINQLGDEVVKVFKVK